MINSLPNDNILDLSKFTAFADDKRVLTQKSQFVLGRVEDIVGKGENAGYQHFLFFPQCFQKFPFPEVLKVAIVWQGVKVCLVWCDASQVLSLLLPEHGIYIYPDKFA